MAKKRTLPNQISPFVWAYIAILQKRGIPIRAAYVFGSWAKGRQHRHSDIDVAIVSPHFTTLMRTMKSLSRAPYSDLASIEPVGFHPREFKPSVSALADEIVKHGIRVI